MLIEIELSDETIIKLKEVKQDLNKTTTSEIVEFLINNWIETKEDFLDEQIYEAQFNQKQNEEHYRKHDLHGGD